MSVIFNFNSLYILFYFFSFFFFFLYGNRHKYISITVTKCNSETLDPVITKGINNYRQSLEFIDRKSGKYSMSFL